MVSVDSIRGDRRHAGAVGYQFSLRTLRWVALIVALATAACLTVYGLTHPAQKPGSLSDVFARSADTLSTALIRPFSLGHHVPAPGRIGWLVIVALLVLGYRAPEAWTLRRQAPCLDTSELTSDRQTMRQARRRTPTPASSSTIGSSRNSSSGCLRWRSARQPSCPVVAGPAD